MRQEAGAPLLSTSRIHKRFNALVVLEAIDFSLRANEAVGIVGPNGAGKTTLLSVLAGAHSPTSGSIAFRGADVTGLPASERCRLGIVRTHQIPQPFSGMTVFENVFVAATNGGRLQARPPIERSIEALAMCGMLRLANRRAETLGLLDRKRLELARALGAETRRCCCSTKSAAA